MVAFQSRDFGRRGRSGDRRQSMTSQQMVLDDTWPSPSKNDCFVDEARTQVAATSEFLDESGAGNNQFFRKQETTSRPHPFLSLDGNNSPREEQFAPPPGFKRAQAGANRVSTAVAPPQAPPFANQNPPQWSVGPQSAHTLSEEKRRALRVFEGPPPGMPEHLIRPEERTNLVPRETHQPVPAAKRRRSPAGQSLPATASKPVVSKEQTKSRLQQLVQPAGVTKSRSGVSNATKARLPNGQRRLPPLKLSQYHYRQLMEYAQSHNGRIPFRLGMGLPVYGKLRYVAAGRLELGVDHGFATQISNAGPTATNGTGYMQLNNHFGTAKSMYTPPQKYSTQQQYGQNVSMPASNPDANLAHLPTTGGTSGSNESVAPTMLEDTNLDEAVEAALRALNEEAWNRTSNDMPATELDNSLSFTSQQSGMQNRTTNSRTSVSNDPILQPAFQYPSQSTVQQSPLSFAALNNSYSSPLLSHTVYGLSSRSSSSSMQHSNIPTTPLFPAPYLPRPDEHQQQRQRSQHPKPVTRTSCPTIPPPQPQQPASHYQQGPLLRQQQQQQQSITPPTSQETGIFSPIPQSLPLPFPFPSSTSQDNINNSTTTTAPSLPLDLESTTLDPNLLEAAGEPVHAYPNGPVVGRLIYGAFWRLGADGTLIPPGQTLGNVVQDQGAGGAAGGGGGGGGGGADVDGLAATDGLSTLDLPSIQGQQAQQVQPAQQARHETREAEQREEADQAEKAEQPQQAQHETRQVEETDKADNAGEDDDRHYASLTAQYLQGYAGYGMVDEGTKGLF